MQKKKVSVLQLGLQLELCVFLFFHTYTPLPFCFNSHFGRCGKKRKHRDTNSYIWLLKDSTELRTLFPYWEFALPCYHFKICCRIWIKLHVLLLSTRTFNTSSVFFYGYGINSFFFWVRCLQEGTVVLHREENSFKKMHCPAQWPCIYFFIYLRHLSIVLLGFMFGWEGFKRCCLFKI